MANAIELKNVTKKYEHFALDHVSFYVPEGSVVGFIGENGAGKSTTIKAILNLIHIDEGEIQIFQKNKMKLETKEHIGVVFDECSFHDFLTTREIDSIMSGIYKNWDSTTFYNLCNRFMLSPDKTVKEYSRGMKMKLSIAVALSHHARLLILDEATSGLDPIARDEILDLFYDFIQEQNSILISSHIISDLEKICDYIAFLHQGKLLFFQRKDELLEKYGVLKCGQKEFEQVDRTLIECVQKNNYHYEVLVNNREKVKQKYPSLMIDRPSLEEIILLYGKGERIL